MLLLNKENVFRHVLLHKTSFILLLCTSQYIVFIDFENRFFYVTYFKSLTLMHHEDIKGQK